MHFGGSYLGSRSHQRGKNAGVGSHPFVVKEVDSTSTTVLAYLRTSQDQQSRWGCLSTPADIVPGLDRPGYILVRWPKRLLLDDLIATNCRVSGVLPPEYIEQMRLMEQDCVRETIKLRRNKR